MSQTVMTHSIKSEIKNTFSIGLPLIASQMVYALSGFIGTAMVSRLGQNALAASVLVSLIWFSLSVLFFGILNASSVLVAHQYGARNEKAISEIMGQSYILGFIICIVLGIILACVPLLLRYCDQPPVVLELANQYVHAMIWQIPGLITLIVGEQFLAAIGRAKIVLRISSMVVPIEIPLIYIFIFGKFGMPACGVAGIGYGFAITYTISAIGLVLYLMLGKQYQKYKIFDSINKINLHYLKELIRIGLPMGLMHAIEVGAFAVATLLMAHFGTTMLAAHQITLQYLGFSITLVFAMSQAVTIRVGHAVGQQDLLGIKYASYTGVFINFGCVAIIALAFTFIPNFFFRLDVDIHNPNNSLLIQNAASMLSIGGLLLIFDNFRIIGFGALRGLKDTRFPMYASFISFWLIGLTTSLILAFKFHLQGQGIWWGLTIGIGFGAILVSIRLRWLLRHIDLKKIMNAK
jgi:MATE family multidrug resistance protein